MHSERANIASEPLFRTVHHYRILFSIISWKKMASTSNECQLQLTLQTFEKDPQLSVRKAVWLYNILHSTLSTRINDVSTRTTTIANSQKLTVLEEEIIVRKVFNLDSRRFLPQIYNIKDIANRLLTIYNTIYIGLYWAFNFVKQ